MTRASEQALMYETYAWVNHIELSRDPDRPNVVRLTTGGWEVEPAYLDPDERRHLAAALLDGLH